MLVAGGGETYHPALRGYLIEVPTLMHGSTAQIAMRIVHEATHARIDQNGLRYTASRRGRIEARCVSEEIAFAQRLPNSDSLVAHARQKLSTPWWTESDLHERRLEQLRAYGWPRWLTTVYSRIFGPRR